MKYDYLVVGAGLFGAVFAHEATSKGKKCLVIDKRKHIAGNIFTECNEGINVHCYGAHIFHTSNKRVWEYINRFAEFNNYVNSPVAIYKDELYNLPFNMNTFSKMWNIKTPQEAKEMIERQRKESGITEPRNLEEQALFLAGRDIYEKLIKGYTEKQWGTDCANLPAFIINRLPFRFTYDNNYFNDRYQGIPIGGYTAIIEKLLKNCDVLLNTDYKEYLKGNPNSAKKTVYTGTIDGFFDYCFGELQYRSLKFVTKTMPTDNFQGNAVVNYTEREIPYTRIIEHRHFEKTESNSSIISYEYPKTWQRGDEPYYPINDEKNTALYKQYAKLAKEQENIIFGGRLGEYKYYDMDKVIERTLEVCEMELNF
jgi:UDP-galactopyranose mutase